MGRKVYIEIGTCDFDTCLDFSEAGWMGYMIEANPIHAAAMRIQCKNNDTEVHNLAISDYNGHIDLLTPKPELDSAGVMNMNGRREYLMLFLIITKEVCY